MTDMVDSKAYRWANRRIEELETERDKALSDAEELRRQREVAFESCEKNGETSRLWHDKFREAEDDAERLRGALESLVAAAAEDSEQWGPDMLDAWKAARAAVHPERGEEQLDPDKPLEPDPTVEVPFGAPVDEVK